MSSGCSCIVHEDIEARLRGGEYLRQCLHALSAAIWKTRSRAVGTQRYLWTRCKPARPCDGRLQFSNASRPAQLTQRPMASDSVASLFVEAFGSFDVRNRKNGQLDLHIDLAPAFSPVSHPHQCRAFVAREPRAGVGAARWSTRLVGSIMRSCGLPRAIDDVRHLIDAIGKIGGHVADNQWHGHLLILLKQASNMRAHEDMGKVP
jgi:hypothetical protein